MKKLIRLGLMALALALAVPLYADSLVCYGSRTTCSYTRKLELMMATPPVAEWMSDRKITIVDCDKVQQPANYAAYRSLVKYLGGQWPQVFVVSDGGKVLGSFVARGYTPASFTAKLESLCGACSDDAGTVTPPAVTPPAAPVTSKFNCPKCKQTLEVK